MPDRPLPAPSRVSAEFWKAARKHELRLQRCQECGRFVFYPRPVCPHCMSDDLRWRRVSGQGKIYSFTIVRRAPFPVFEKDLPYVFAMVELAEGPRIATNIVGIEPEKVAIGTEVEAVFDDVAPGVTLVKFKPRGK